MSEKDKLIEELLQRGLIEATEEPVLTKYISIIGDQDLPTYRNEKELAKEIFKKLKAKCDEVEGYSFSFSNIEMVFKQLLENEYGVKL